MKFNEQKPIYLQIAEVMGSNIISGQWKEGERIPSVREMGVNLAVNPATVLRAYDELSSFDVIEQRRGLGYFVAVGAAEKVLDRRKREFTELFLPQLFEQMQGLNITLEEVAECYNKYTAK